MVTRSPRHDVDVAAFIIQTKKISQIFAGRSNVYRKAKRLYDEKGLDHPKDLPGIGLIWPARASRRNLASRLLKFVQARTLARFTTCDANRSEANYVSAIQVRLQ
jgi:hypothetical protein